MTDTTTETIPAVQETTAPHHHHRRRRRFPLFALIGGTILLLGIAIQYGLIRIGVPAAAAYVAQGVTSIQLSWLANRYLTWRDRDVVWYRSLWRWNTQRMVSALIQFWIYGFAVHFLDVNWLAANLAITAVATPVNYLLGDRWSFKTTIEIPPLRVDVAKLPSVSVVIPCKNNATTIGKTMDALLAQDYPRLLEVIVVGDVGDPTFDALPHHPYVTVVEQPPCPGRRDPSVKRDTGARRAVGHVLAFVDSDIVMESDWMSLAVSQLIEQGGGVVCGGMRTIKDGYWGRFVDTNTLAAKTPRLENSYYVTAENFGKRGTKPPIGANMVMTREVYDACPPDKTWTYGYEDYEWFWRIARQRHQIAFTGELTAEHHHRESFRALLREYRRAAEGCAHFALRYPDSPLGRKRRMQAFLLPFVALLGVALTVLVVMQGYVLPLLGTLGVGTGVLMVREAKHAKTREATTYPFPAVTLAGTFAGQLSWSMIRYSRAFRYAAAIAGVIVYAITLRAIALNRAPDWQMDEVTYTSIAKDLLYHNKLSLPQAYGLKWRPFLFHPPFYFWTLSKWFGLIGPSIYHARILGLMAVGVGFILLAVFLWQSYGPVVALVASAFIATDGWLLYVQRVSYIENLLIVLILASLLLYRYALRSNQWRWFIVAGVVIGFTAIFKHTGTYIILAAVIAWLIIRKSHLKHLALIGTSGLVVLLYVWYMIHTNGLQSSFTRPFEFAWGTNNWYVHQTLVQLRRTLGQQASGGSLGTPGQFLHLLTSQYAVFIPSLAVAAFGAVTVITDVIRFLRHRAVLVDDEIVLPAWCLAGIVAFGLIAIKYSQYFSLALIPLYCYACLRVVRWCQVHRWRMLPAVIVCAGVALVGLSSFYLRITASPGNVFQEAGNYVSVHVPKNAIVIANTPIDYEIPQRWCSPNGATLSGRCLRQAEYIVTWTTYLQSSNPNDSIAFAALLKRSTVLHTIQGFNGTVTVRRIDGKLDDHAKRLRSTTKGQS